jgi:ketosteroid isomerase-like protein
MNRLVWLSILWAPLLFAGDCPKQAKDADALAQTEQNWARALEARDANVIGCILGEEFEDYSSKGAVYKRAEVLANLPQRKAGHNELSGLQPHLEGDFAYVRGLNTVSDASGAVVARVRFTDIFAYRDGRWVAVAGQESLVQE